jgi:hypothetical protein
MREVLRLSKDSYHDQAGMPDMTKQACSHDQADLRNPEWKTLRKQGRKHTCRESNAMAAEHYQNVEGMVVIYSRQLDLVALGKWARVLQKPRPSRLEIA